MTSACNNADFKRASENVLPVAEANEDFSVAFLGTTSFLLESKREQVIIDGYLSRSKHGLFRRIKPKPGEIRRWIEALNICKSLGAKNTSDQPAACANLTQPRLALVLTLHGHYDHSMDASYIAGWAGAPLVRDPSLDLQWAATEELLRDRSVDFNWETASRIDISAHLGTQPVPLPLSAMDIRLFETPHNQNLISGHIKKETPSNFRFPSRIWNFGEGKSISALVTLNDNRRMLFVGSAGNVGPVFRKNRVKTDVIFLSIGGLGVQDSKAWSKYWKDTVEATSAERVFLIHWDNHQKPLPDPGGNLSPTFFEPHSKVFAHLSELATKQGVELVFPPVGRRFSPFD